MRELALSIFADESGGQNVSAQGTVLCVATAFLQFRITYGSPPCVTTSTMHTTICIKSPGQNATSHQQPTKHSQAISRYSGR